MRPWSAICRFLPLLAVLGLLLTPVATTAASAAMRAGPAAPVTGSTGLVAHDVHRDDVRDVAGAGMEEMPCCPDAKAGTPDLAGKCPLTMLCVASVAVALPSAIVIPAPVAVPMVSIWPRPSPFASVPGTPLPEPPRA